MTLNFFIKTFASRLIAASSPVARPRANETPAPNSTYSFIRVNKANGGCEVGHSVFTSVFAAFTMALQPCKENTQMSPCSSAGHLILRGHLLHGGCSRHTSTTLMELFEGKAAACKHCAKQLLRLCTYVFGRENGTWAKTSWNKRVSAGR